MLLEHLPETSIKLALPFLGHLICSPCQPLGVLFCCCHCQANRKSAVIYARRPGNKLNLHLQLFNSIDKGILMSEAGLPSHLKSFLASRPLTITQLCLQILSILKYSEMSQSFLFSFLCLLFNYNVHCLIIFCWSWWISSRVAGKSVCGWGRCAQACAANTAAAHLDKDDKEFLGRTSRDLDKHCMSHHHHKCICHIVQISA